MSKNNKVIGLFAVVLFAASLLCLGYWRLYVRPYQATRQGADIHVILEEKAQATAYEKLLREGLRGGGVVTKMDYKQTLLSAGRPGEAQLSKVLDEILHYPPKTVVIRFHECPTLVKFVETLRNASIETILLDSFLPREAALETGYIGTDYYAAGINLARQIPPNIPSKNILVLASDPQSMHVRLMRRGLETYYRSRYQDPPIVRRQATLLLRPNSYKAIIFADSEIAHQSLSMLNQSKIPCQNYFKIAYDGDLSLSDALETHCLDVMQIPATFEMGYTAIEQLALPQTSRHLRHSGKLVNNYTGQYSVRPFNLLQQHYQNLLYPFTNEKQ